jgi:hypothetical protein
MGLRLGGWRSLTVPSSETDRMRVCLILWNGARIVGDFLVEDAFGVQVMRQGEPYGERIPYRLVRLREYFKARPSA